MWKRDWKLDRLASIDVLAHVPKRKLREACSLTTVLTLPAGRVLWQEGETAQEAYLLLDGQIELSWAGTPFETVSAGSIVGGLGLAESGPRVATGTTLTEVEALVMSRAEYRRLLRLFPEVAGRVDAKHRARVSRMRAVAVA